MDKTYSEDPAYTSTAIAEKLSVSRKTVSQKNNYCKTDPDATFNKDMTVTLIVFINDIDTLYKGLYQRY